MSLRANQESLHNFLVDLKLRPAEVQPRVILDQKQTCTLEDLKKSVESWFHSFKAVWAVLLILGHKIWT